VDSLLLPFFISLSPFLPLELCFVVLSFLWFLFCTRWTTSTVIATKVLLPAGVEATTKAGVPHFPVPPRVFGVPVYAQESRKARNGTVCEQ